MKVQEVILKAMAGTLKWGEAAEIIWVTDRTMRRWRERYQEGGYDGLYNRRKQRPSPKRVALKTAETVSFSFRDDRPFRYCTPFAGPIVESHDTSMWT